MVTREFRLRKQADITRVLRHGRRKSTKYCTLRWSPNRVGVSRMAVIVSKKYDNRAVVRNRARRRVREVMRLNWSRIPVSFDILVTVQSDIAGLTPAQLKSDIEYLISQIGSA